MGTQWHNHVYLCADPFDKAADLGQIGWHVKRAIHRPKDIDAGGGTFGALFLGGHPAFGHAKFRENPRHRTVRRFPLILVNGARQEPLDIGALRRHTATDHLGN